MALNRIAARKVHQRRVRLGLSPEQYGVRVGCSGMTVRRIEEGYRTFRSTQVKIANDLGVEVDDLFPLSLDRRKVLA